MDCILTVPYYTETTGLTHLKNSSSFFESNYILTVIHITSQNYSVLHYNTYIQNEFFRDYPCWRVKHGPNNVRCSIQFMNNFTNMIIPIQVVINFQSREFCVDRLFYTYTHHCQYLMDNRENNLL